MLNKSVAAAAAAVALLSVAVAPARAESVKNVVIVHGAFADGSGWRQVAEILVKDGYTVSVVQEPLTSLPDDVAATKRVLDLQPGPTLLVGHSYGGVVITEAGNAPVTAAAWHQKKSWALVATRDRNINSDLERSMAKRAGSETIELPASHAVYLSKPNEVARLIERAARASAQ